MIQPGEIGGGNNEGNHTLKKHIKNLHQITRVAGNIFVYMSLFESMLFLLIIIITIIPIMTLIVNKISIKIMIKMTIMMILIMMMMMMMMDFAER